MAENIALVKKKQKTFNSSVKKYKKLFKKGPVAVENEASPAKESSKSTKTLKRGIVYIGNIPHGFYERQMLGYFGQFGRVTRVRCARSKKTGCGKGYGFIEFQEPEVASIVAETMNNYLMGKRLLKAKYISPEEQGTKSYFKGKNYTEDRYPALLNRIKDKKAHNAILSEELVKKKTIRALKSIAQTQKKLQDLNIEYDFQPVDVPAFVLAKEGVGVDTDEEDVEFDESNVGIVFTPPDIMLQKIRAKAAALKESATELEQEKRKGKSKVKQLKVDNGVALNDVPTPKQSKKKQKLIGVSKNKSKSAKPAKLNNEKAKLIKQQLNDQDQLRLKTPKSIKTEVKTPNKKKSPKKAKLFKQICDQDQLTLNSPKSIKQEVKSPKSIKKEIKSPNKITSPKSIKKEGKTPNKMKSPKNAKSTIKPKQPKRKISTSPAKTRSSTKKSAQ